MVRRRNKIRMTRWGLLLAAAGVLWAQGSPQVSSQDSAQVSPLVSVDRLDTSKKLLETDPAGALDYATKAAALNVETERWFWPVILEAELKLGRWEAAAGMGAKSVADIEAGRMFTRVYQTLDEIKLRQLYATALDRCGKPEEAKAQRAIAELLSSPTEARFGETHSGESGAQAIVAAEWASRIKYAKADLLATEGNTPARLFAAYDLDGRVADLHAQKGKIVIALFWATWCGPCMQELGALNRIYPQLRERAEVMAVDVDDKPDVVKEFAQKQQVAFPILTVPSLRSLGAEISSYTAGATMEDPNIPQLYVIDGDGNIRFHLRGFDDDGLFEQRLNWMMAAVK
jgi:peroxiredoxin